MKCREFIITPKNFKQNTRDVLKKDKEKLVKLIFKRKELDNEIQECMYNIETEESMLK